MTKDTFSDLRRNIESIMGMDSASIETIQSHAEELLQILNETIDRNRENLSKEVEVPNFEEMLITSKELLRLILSGNQDYGSIRKLALKALQSGTSIYQLALLLSHILNYMKDNIQGKLKEGEKVMKSIEKFSVIMLLLLADEINQAFLEAVREATGMSQALLENYMKAVINEFISRNGS